MRYWKPRKVKGSPLVTMQVATYLNQDPRRMASLRCLIASLQAQTYPDWEALLVHDGPCASRDALGPLLLADPRLRWFETDEREGKFGHRWRQQVVRDKGRGEIVGFTNDDNYYAPVYLEWMLAEMQQTKADFVHCDMVHSHRRWQSLHTRPAYRHLDLGGFLLTAKLVREVPWKDWSFKGDGAFINSVVKKCRRIVKVPALLFVHN